MAEELRVGDLTNEVSRTYSVYDVGGCLIYEDTVRDPIKVFFGHGHCFQRVVDASGTATLHYAPGVIIKDGVIVGYCKLSWQPKDTNNPCRW